MQTPSSASRIYSESGGRRDLNFPLTALLPEKGGNKWECGQWVLLNLDLLQVSADLINNTLPFRINNTLPLNTMIQLSLSVAIMEKTSAWELHIEEQQRPVNTSCHKETSICDAKMSNN